MQRRVGVRACSPAQIGHNPFSSSATSPGRESRTNKRVGQRCRHCKRTIRSSSASSRGKGHSTSAPGGARCARPAPSDYGLLPEAEGRGPQGAESSGRPGPHGPVAGGQGSAGDRGRFFERWGRDYDADFQVRIDRFQRLSDPWTLRQVVEENREILAELLDLDVRDYLHARGLIPRSTLQSIPTDSLLPKAREILFKRRRNPAHAAEAEEIAQAVTAWMPRCCWKVGPRTGWRGSALGKGPPVDPCRRGRGLFRDLAMHLPLAGAERLTCVRGHDVEIEFAPATHRSSPGQGGRGLHGR